MAYPKMEYTLITFTEKGFARIEQKSEADVAKLFADLVSDGEDPSELFVTAVNTVNSEYLGEHYRYMLIKGTVVSLKPVTKVTEWKVE